MLFASMQSYSQNEFYINGAFVKIESGASIHVQGDFHLDNEGANDGQLDNDGTIELRGNYVINSANTEQTSVANNSTGVVRFKNYGYTTNTPLHEDLNQRIEMIGTDATGDRAFYNIEIANDNQSSASSDDNFVYIKGGNVEIKNQLKFDNSIESRIITTDVLSGYDGNDGSSYVNTLTISSPLVTAIDFGTAINDANATQHSINRGRTSRYVEGKLSRQVSGTGHYYFPVGLQPGAVGSGNDGMEAFSLDITGADPQNITAYINTGADRTYIANQNIYGDVGEHPGSGWNNPFSSCNGAPDGTQDYIFLNDAQTHEWQIDNAGVDFTYDIEIYPGQGLNSTSPKAVQAEAYLCGANSFVVRYLVKDGVLHDRTTGDALTVAAAPHPFNTANFPDGYHYLPPATELEGNKLSNLTSFSTFRIHGAQNASTILPVTIASFDAYPVNNEFIQVAWLTLSELNNDFFEVERSTNLLEWNTLGYVEGNGTTNEQQAYLFDDFSAEYGITYYYRLRQVDFDGSAEYIGPDDAKLEIDGLGFTVSEFIPSPAFQSSEILITTAEDKKLNYIFYNDLGQIIKQGNIEVSAGSVNQPLEFKELNKLAASTYFLTLTDGEDVFYRKLMKVN